MGTYGGQAAALSSLPLALAIPPEGQVAGLTSRAFGRSLSAMKAFIAVWLCLLGISAVAQEPYVVLKSGSFVRTPDGFSLQLKQGDCIPANGKNDSGAWVRFTIAGMKGSIPWHEADLISATPNHRAAYRAVVDRIEGDYKAALAKRDAKAIAAADAAQARAEQKAHAAEELRRLQFLSELQAIRHELEIMNRRRMK